MSALRREVLSLYKRILRTGKNWEAVSGNSQHPELEGKYIINETKELFHKNKNLKNEEEIKSRLMEADSRLQMALHYRIPYPRPVNLPPQALASPLGKRLKKQCRLRKQSRPIYIKSLDSET
ncbi:LYR motif-containing protein 1-like [Tachypleus tridentatus]|uniref:LYR motif-containing protein 1-like n=1 Tax=Tachypleus tridentatus TaxID=6853 RepID=UPI003FD67AD9